MTPRWLPLAGLAAALAAGPALADQVPRSAGAHPNVRTVPYNPLNVVRVVATPTTSTQIVFAPDEEVTQVSVGDDAAWLVEPTGNMVFVKPAEVRAPTNATVVTRRADGSRRSYQLRLVAARAGGGDADGEGGATFALAFTYPGDAAAARSAAAQRNAALGLERAAQQRLALAWADGPRNWRYVAQGSAMLEPTSVSDNGRVTAFRFPGNMRLPTIYTVAPDGSETVVPTQQVGDVTVVQTTAQQFVLRDGREALRIVNQAFDPVGRDPGTGTGAPDVVRQVRGRS